MADQGFHVVTGAFGFTGKYIAARLLAAGQRVRTLTGSPGRAHPFGSEIDAVPFQFEHKAHLIQALQGASVFYNTYWVRFSEGDFSQTQAVENTLRLFDAARRAGVARVVHASITNPSIESPFEYFRNKAVLEQALTGSGVAHTILRPALLFGKEDILINNIAWLLRRMPVFGVFGDGEYRLQPIFVDDFAALAIEEGRAAGNRTIDAIGPETFTYRELVHRLGQAIDVQRPIVSVPVPIALMTARIIGKLTGDVLITKDEMQGLMAGLLCTDSPPVGGTSLIDWAAANAEHLGHRYASEVARREDRRTSFRNL